MILVFAKAPVPGTVKTRLIPALGDAGAAELHRRMVWQTLSVVAAAGEPVTLCCAPDTAHPFFVECARRFGALLETQEGADLGARMAHALQGALDRGGQTTHAVLVGTDCPALDVPTLLAAVQSLREHDYVFVPVEDGGYALVGARRADSVAQIFTQIAWSTAEVMAQTRLRLMSRGASWQELATSWDVDEAADLARLSRHDAGRALLDGLFPATPFPTG